MKILATLAALVGLSTPAASVDAGQKEKVEHSVIIHFEYGSRDLQPLFALEDKLEAVMTQAGVGEYDGNEVATDGSDGYLYFYGPDADKLFQSIKSTLEATAFMRGAEVRKRYGPAGTGAREIVMRISP